MTELESVCEEIEKAQSPEDIFGKMVWNDRDEQLAGLKRRYRLLARAVHPDVNGGDSRASAAFMKLEKFYDQAEMDIGDGVYGKPRLVVDTRHHHYSVFNAIEVVGVADVYQCTIDGRTPGEFHIAKSPRDNDLMKAEATSLKTLLGDPEGRGFFYGLPVFEETFTHRDGGIDRTVNTFQSRDGYVTLADVIAANPKGLHEKDMAWIFRRLLDVLGYAHSKEIVHGAVVPTNILVGLGDVHEVVLRGWQNSVPMGGRVPAIVPGYKPLYPVEVLNKDEAFHGTDVAMAAACMHQLVHVYNSDRIKGFLMASMLSSRKARSIPAWDIRKEFTDLIENLWGKREYRPLQLSTTS